MSILWKNCFFQEMNWKQNLDIEKKESKFIPNHGVEYEPHQSKQKSYACNLKNVCEFMS